MCSDNPPRNAAWLGWSDVPTPAPQIPAGEWIDLTHILSPALSRSPVFPEPVFRKFHQIPAQPANVTEIQMVVHHGTHVDAPRHFIADGPTFDQIPLERLYGPGVVWRIEVPAMTAITAEHLEAARPQVQPGDMVLLDTGWAAFVNTERYEDHPHLDAGAAQWLIDQGVKLVSVDFSTPDVTAHARPPGFNWPVHQILLSRGILIAEHVTNLRSLAGQRVEAIFLALPIEGADGSPVRAIARPIA